MEINETYDYLNKRVKEETFDVKEGHAIITYFGSEGGDVRTFSLVNVTKTVLEKCDIPDPKDCTKAVVKLGDNDFPLSKEALTSIRVHLDMLRNNELDVLVFHSNVYTAKDFLPAYANIEANDIVQWESCDFDQLITFIEGAKPDITHPQSFDLDDIGSVPNKFMISVDDQFLFAIDKVLKDNHPRAQELNIDVTLLTECIGAATATATLAGIARDPAMKGFTDEQIAAIMNEVAVNLDYTFKKKMEYLLDPTSEHYHRKSAEVIPIKKE